MDSPLNLLLKEANVSVADLLSFTQNLIAYRCSIFDSAPLFNIFLHRKRNVVIKHDHTQTALAHDWLNQSSWNEFEHAAKVTSNAPIYTNEVLRYQFVHRKISTVTFGTSHVCMYVSRDYIILLELKYTSKKQAVGVWTRFSWLKEQLSSKNWRQKSERCCGKCHEEVAVMDNLHFSGILYAQPAHTGYVTL